MAAPEKPILILGGGVNGAALARELLLNRVHVRLVDAADIAYGATAYSSRLIHGGLRYLEYGEFDLVRESVAERTRLLQQAPQFVSPLPLFIPVSGRWSGWAQAARRFWRLPESGQKARQAYRGLCLVRLGLWLYDRCARDGRLPRHRVHAVGEAGVPAVAPEIFRWLCCYHDAQAVFPERLVVALLEDARRLAAEHGLSFQVFTYHRAALRNRVVEVFRQPGGSLASATEGGGEPIAAFEPAAIVNATGAWVDLTLRQLNAASRRLMGGTKGSHLLSFQPRLRELLGGRGVYAEAPDGRPFFLLPFGEAVLAGTTDIPFEGPPENAVASEAELDYLLQSVNRVFPQAALGRDDIDLHYSGVRPLPYVSGAAPAAITRRHWVEEHSHAPLPLFSVIGGKLTTCRSLAEETARAVLERLGTPVVANSRERVIPGGEDYPAGAAALDAEQERLARRTRLTRRQVETVWKLFGSRAAAMLDPDGEVEPDGAENLEGTQLPLRCVRRVIRDEWVARLGDLVERRLMLLYHRHLSAACLRRLARSLAEQGLLAEEEIEAEVRACAQRLRVHFGKRLSAGA